MTSQHERIGEGMAVYEERGGEGEMGVEFACGIVVWWCEKGGAGEGDAEGGMETCGMVEGGDEG